MVKKLKAMADKSRGDSQLAGAIKESAQEIWLAGLGAFAKAQEEGQKVFKALVREGGSMQKRTMKATEDTVSDVSGRVNDVTNKVTQVREADASPRRTSERCPAWSAPMVGISATVSPCSRQSRTTRRRSPTVRTVSRPASVDTS